MPKILELSPHVADLIAAGEVVERPGSVIKELVENAVDAGATAITVEIKNGGMTYIRISDNGCGIAPEEAETAFLRHATSKLRTDADLAAIHTLGFRGEALAAIASVSKIQMLSRETGAGEGVSLSLEAGQVISKTVAGCPEGTTMIIRDLFYNTPARLKFMKSDKAEGANVSAQVVRLALANPQVSVRYIKDGTEEAHTSGDGRLDSCIYSLLGRDFSGGLLSVETKDENLSVSGFVTAPYASRGNRAYQFFYLNGRYIKSKLLQAALEQAYKNSLSTGRYPCCVMHIQVKPNTVDVNVHPTKIEVKFLNERQVFDAVYYAVLSGLSGEKNAPEIPISPRTLQSVTPPSAEIPSRVNTNSYKPMPASEFKTESEYSSVSTEERGWAEVRQPKSTYHSSYTESAKSPVLEPSPPHIQTNEHIYPMVPPQSPPQQQSLVHDQVPLPSFRIIGETLGIYILVEQEDGILLIDKHAAHERLLFDRFKADGSEIMSQYLLSPVVVSVSTEEAVLLDEHKDLLEEFGFELEAFGDGAVIMRRIPSDMEENSAKALITELCETLSTGQKVTPAVLRDEILHTVACKAAIKAGRSSTPAEWVLLAQKVAEGEIKYCPHGRPVSMQLSKTALNRHFKRTN